MSDLPMAASVSLSVNPAQGAALPATAGTKTHAQISKAAGEFESILLNQWLESAEATFGSVPGGDDEADSGDAQIKSFAVQILAKSMTAAGGVGLAALVAKALEARAADGDSQPSASPGKAQQVR